MKLYVLFIVGDNFFYKNHICRIGLRHLVVNSENFKQAFETSSFTT